MHPSMHSESFLDNNCLPFALSNLGRLVVHAKCREATVGGGIVFHWCKGASGGKTVCLNVLATSLLQNGL